MADKVADGAAKAVAGMKGEVESSILSGGTKIVKRPRQSSVYAGFCRIGRWRFIFYLMVRTGGLELPRACAQRILSLLTIGGNSYKQ